MLRLPNFALPITGLGSQVTISNLFLPWTVSIRPPGEDAESGASFGSKRLNVQPLKAHSEMMREISVADTSVFTLKAGCRRQHRHALVAMKHKHVLNFSTFKKPYQIHSPKIANTILNSLLAHCLWYYVRPGGAPHITLVDDFEQYDLDQFYELELMSPARSETVKVREYDFYLVHIKLLSSPNWDHSVAYCAAKRLVREESIRGKIPGLFNDLQDGDANFVYQCYVSSPFLDEHVRSERTSFDIDEEQSGLFSGMELSFNDIRKSVMEKVNAFLSDYLEESKEMGRQRVHEFVAHKAPRYRPILSRIPENELAIDPKITDRELDIHLHKHLSALEGELLREGHDILDPFFGEDDEKYGSRINEYLAKVEEIKKSDLANYVSHRRVIIDLFAKAIQKDEKGKYAREELLHGLIMPMRTDSTEVPLDACNLWMVDERLAFHDYLASDKRLRDVPITGSSDEDRPDIISLKTFDNPILVLDGDTLPPASLVVIEFKRPMRDDAKEGEKNDPIEQALGYLDRVRQGIVMTAKGRPIRGAENVPGFCYVICDLTKSVEQRCKMHNANRTMDGLGYFYYHSVYKAYVNVMSFEQVLNGAKERNKAFFDKLGLPSVMSQR